MHPQSSIQKIEFWGYPGMEVELGSVRTFSDEEFLEFCRGNPDARIERESNGEIILMAPTFTETGGMNGELYFQLMAWTKTARTGRAFDSSTGFALDNGALRSPDASWVSNERWDALSDEERSGFAKICPDFVVELRSTSDNLEKLKGKMDEYISNGSVLGWLIDPVEKRIHVYRPGKEVEVQDNPAVLSAEPELAGFTLRLSEVWG